MTKTGKPFERIVECLEKTLGPCGAKVSTRKCLPDVRTGKPREHDVVIEIDHGHHRLIIAVECRDHSRVIDTPKVESFYQKCLDTGVSKGVMVSAKGFSAPARTKADAVGIRCLQLSEVDSFPWLATAQIDRFRYRMVTANWLAVPLDPNQNLTGGTEFVLVDGSDQPVSQDQLIENMRKPFSELADSAMPGGPFCVKFLLSAPGCRMRNGDDEYAIKGFIVEVEGKLESSPLPLQLFRYTDASKKTDIAKVALAHVNDGKHRGTIVVDMTTNNVGNINFIPLKDS